MEKFHYHTLEELIECAARLGVHLPFAAETDVLKEALKVRGITLRNRLGIAPMEGADALPDGSPSELTLRRYVREAEGGSAVIWFEAISIVPEGRSGSTQLFISKENLEQYKRFCACIREAGMKKNGYAPYLIMQANHSGRYSNPENRPAPIIAYRNPVNEQFRAADDSCIASDDYLKSLEERFGESAVLAKEAGFDAVDIKACHGYLLAELLSAYERPGIYGGSLENRSRLLRNGILAAKPCEDEHFMVTCRLGIYDGLPWPYGFGVSFVEDEQSTAARNCSDPAKAAELINAAPQPDLREAKTLVRELHEKYGLDLIDLTMGNPYVTTHVTRPFDRGKYEPKEHPLCGIARMINGIGEVKREVPGMAVYGSAPSYLRQYADLFAAGAVEEGLIDGMLFGRLSFADPDFANEIIHNGRIDPQRVCVTCGGCGDLIRAHKPTGCIVRNAAEYGGYYREFLKEKADLPANFRG